MPRLRKRALAEANAWKAERDDKFQVNNLMLQAQHSNVNSPAKCRVVTTGGLKARAKHAYNS